MQSAILEFNVHHLLYYLQMVAKIIELSILIIGLGGYTAIFFLSLFGSAIIPIPNELVMLFGGFKAFSGQFSIFTVVLLGTLGNLTGCIVCYYIGLFGGRPFLEKYGKFLLVTPKKLQWSDSFFEKYGHEAVFITRLIPVVRAVNSLPAGISRMDLKKFILYSFAGSLVWATGLGLAGFYLGPYWQTVMHIFRKLDLVIIASLVVAVGFYIYKSLK